ncbi:MAG: LysM peptidoglycan-binding domain-containing protein [Anaerolineaceae bacterium]|nr:MAG: LysM peptidoglycan-binding domain-containing protein [Anaerolineaceae bacterium]
MGTHIRLYGVLSILMIFALTACYQSASGADIVPLQGLERSTQTPLPLPSDTPGPSPTGSVIEVEVTTVVEVIVTATPDPATATPVEVAMGQEQALDEPFTEGMLDEAALPQDEGIIPFEEQDLEREQDDIEGPTLDPLFATATQFILEATYEVQTMTATAMGPVQVQPTVTPTPDPVQPVQPEQPLASPTPQPPPPGADCVHVVRAGENLFRLSMRYGVSVNDIARASGVQNIQLIVVGQELTIPGCGTTGIRPPGTAGTSDGTGTSGFVGGTTHVVQQGETLFQISMRYGVSVNDIVAANPSITNPNFILMTSEIVIPGR